MFHETLTESLQAGSIPGIDLVGLWPNRPVFYGETVRVHVDDGTRYGRIISVYRNNQTGRYETALTYRC